MKPYVDTNFFCRLYLPLPETDEAATLMAKAQAAVSPALPITWLHRLETINAFQLCVFAGKSHGQRHITLEQASAAHANFKADLAQNTFLRFAQLDLTKLEAEFEELALRHTAKYGFRTYDMLHVAAAILLKCDTFWSFDPKASKLASLEGLAIR
jgi:predicted nucleic acid-binding protein